MLKIDSRFSGKPCTKDLLFLIHIIIVIYCYRRILIIVYFCILSNYIIIKETRFSDYRIDPWIIPRFTILHIYMSEMQGHRAFLLGSEWHNWSPNAATVTGWTKCFTEEVPVLRDTLYKQSSLDQEQCWFTWNCLVTALVFVFDICNCICLLFCNLLGEFTVIVLEFVWK